MSETYFCFLWTYTQYLVFQKKGDVIFWNNMMCQSIANHLSETMRAYIIGRYTCQDDVQAVQSAAVHTMMSLREHVWYVCEWVDILKFCEYSECDTFHSRPQHFTLWWNVFACVVLCNHYFLKNSEFLPVILFLGFVWKCHWKATHASFLLTHMTAKKQIIHIC